MGSHRSAPRAAFLTLRGAGGTMASVLGIVKLDSPVQHYAWGSHTTLARLQGRPPAAEPEAELWMGTHPQAPSVALLDGRRLPLDQLIAGQPQAALGRAAAAFDGELPFLFKVLAIAAPLSIQAHPSREQAQAGFAREDGAGVPRDAAHRSYRDRNHKPEVVCAYEPMWVLSGFRPFQELVHHLQAIDAPGLRAAVAGLAHAPSSARLGQLFAELLRLEGTARAELVARTVAVELGTAEAEWVSRLAQAYPEDVGVVSPYLLNLVRLEPGEALFTGAGTLHAYLDGTGIELMANSDNVLRGGLTAKHIDVAELLRIGRFEPQPPARVAADSVAGERQFVTASAEFRLSEIQLDAGDATFIARTDNGPEIVLALDGDAALSAGDATVRCAPGEAAFVPACVDRYRAQGTARLFRARVPAAAATEPG